MYLESSELKMLKVEITTKCNAACPLCSRFEFGDTSKPKKSLPMHDLSLSVFKKAITKEVCNNLDILFFCGKFGDPLMHPDLLDFIKYIKSISSVKIVVHTNAALRSEKFWNELASLLSTDDYVAFAIDGLEDTNYIYRQNTNWKTIMRNAKAFINAGGVANWDYLIFDHNKHQLTDAKALAKTMGFKSFNERKSARVYKPKELLKNNVGDCIKIKTEKKAISIKDENIKLINNKKHTGVWDKSIEIECRFKNIGRMFLSFEGKLWPCCFIAPEFPNTPYVNRLILKYGNEFNSLEHYSIEEILEHEYFKEALERAWQEKDHNLSTECVKRCRRNKILKTKINAEIL